VGLEYKSTTTTSAYKKATSSTYKKKPLKNTLSSIMWAQLLWNYIERKQRKN
jgi:hypothetical protein